MKATYNDFVTKEAEKKLVSVGGRFGKPKAIYTKDDFMTPGQVAKKFNITLEQAKNTMKDLVFKRSIFMLNGHKAPIVTRLGKPASIYLHPMGIAAFQKHLDEQKD
jgi:hypothetical protein